MFNRELNFSDIIFLTILCGIMSIIFGCASAPKVYYCPNEHSILMEKINKDIRAINTCLVCGAKFPYLEKKKSGGYYFGYAPYYPQPRVWVYSYRTTRFHSYRRHHHGHQLLKRRIFQCQGETLTLGRALLDVQQRFFIFLKSFTYPQFGLKKRQFYYLEMI